MGNNLRFHLLDSELDIDTSGSWSQHIVHLLCCNLASKNSNLNYFLTF